MGVDGRVLIRDGVPLLLVLGKEIEKALVPANLDYSDLVRVPALREHLFDVAFVESKILFMYVRTVRAKEGSEGNVAVGGAIPLTVDAEGVVAIVLDLPLQECAYFLRLGISHHCGLARWSRGHKSILIQDHG